jgi:hypothetical protein
MPVKTKNIILTGSGESICCYYANGLNIIRAASSLDATRVKEDPAFEGFRKSSDRLKQASPIAAALYNQIPKERKRFSLYRILTGKIIIMIKSGIEQEVIIASLQQKYIDPILHPKKRGARYARQFNRLSSFCKRLFTTRNDYEKKRTILKRQILPQYAGAEWQESRGVDYAQLRRKRMLPTKELAAHPIIPGLIYLGRVKGHGKFKLWLEATAGRL